MSAFSACPPVQNTSAEGLQDQGAPPMRSANENPPPTPSPLSADELNRWSSPPPPPLERCAPTADEFQGVSPMAEVGGNSGMSSAHIQNMGAMGPLTQGPASAASLPFFCPPSFQNVVNRTSVYALDVIDRVFVEVEGGLETWARGAWNLAQCSTRERVQLLRPFRGPATLRGNRGNSIPPGEIYVYFSG